MLCPHCKKEHTQADFNEETRKTLEDSEKGIGLIEYQSIEEAFEDIFDDPSN